MPIKTSVVDQKPVVVGLFCEEQIEGGSYRGPGIKFERKILNAGHYLIFLTTKNKSDKIISTKTCLVLTACFLPGRENAETI